MLRRVAEMVRASEPELVEHVEKTARHRKALEKQVEQLKNKLAQSAAGDLESQARTVKDVTRRRRAVDGMDRAQLRTLADSLRNKWKSGVVVLASAEDGNVSIVSAVTKDLTRRCTPASWSAPSRRPSAAKAAAVPTWPKAAARIRRRCEPLSKTSTAMSKAMMRESFDALVVGAGPTGLACGIELQQPRRQDRPDREGLRRELDLSLPHQHGLLHHAGAARNRQHPDDQPQR